MEDKKQFLKDKSILFLRIISLIAVICSAIYLINYAIVEIKAKRLSDDMADKHAAILSSETLLTSSEEVDDSTEENDSEKEIVSASGQLCISNVSKLEEYNDDEEVILEEEREPLVIRPSMQEFYDENPDTVGWITVGGTKIDNVVVQADDNNKYLHTNFKQQESQPGTIFADYRCKVSTYPDLRSDNIILYGHKQRSGTMFGTLDRYKNNFEFYKENPTFTFSTLYDEETYKIVSVFIAAVDEKDATANDVFDYQNYIDFNKEKSFTNFIVNIKQRSQYAIPVSIQKGDKFVTLSTCSYEFSNARLVVVGRKVREGEDPTVDVTNAMYVGQHVY